MNQLNYYGSSRRSTCLAWSWVQSPVSGAEKNNNNFYFTFLNAKTTKKRQENKVKKKKLKKKERKEAVFTLEEMNPGPGAQL
jgi:hypothetical protein